MTILYPPLPLHEQIRRSYEPPAWYTNMDMTCLNDKKPKASAKFSPANRKIGRPRGGELGLRGLIIQALVSTPWQTNLDLAERLGKSSKGVGEVLRLLTASGVLIRRLLAGRTYEYALADEKDG